MKSKPFLIKKSGEELGLEEVQSNAPIFSESWLQNLIKDHPQILPVDEIEQVFTDLVSIGTEIPVGVGFIDNLLISKMGYPVLVETKLWRNSEAKREVVAQAIDYGSALAKWTFEALNDVSIQHTKKNLIDLITDKFDLDPEEIPTEETIGKNLKLGRFLILIVSEKIRESLIDMLKFAEWIPHLATNIGLVELQCYTMPQETGDIVVVPSIVARTEVIRRSVIQVNIKPDNIPHDIESVPEKVEEVIKDGRTTLSEEVFWEIMQKKAPLEIDNARKIIEHMNKNPEVVIKMRQDAISVRLMIPESDQKISLFFITTSGIVNCWVQTIKEQLPRTGLKNQIGLQYIQEMTQLLKSHTKTLAYYFPANKIEIDKLFKVVDKFIEQATNLDNIEPS